MEKMKWNIIPGKLGLFIWGIWTAISAFITPFWVSVALIGAAGQMEKFDWSLHEGDGDGWVFIGVLLLIFWGLIAVFPGIAFLRKMKEYGKKITTIAYSCVTVFLLAGARFAFFWK